VPPSEFFDLLSTSPDRWTTLQISGREWQDTTICHQAWDAAIARKRASGTAVTTFTVESGNAPEARELEHTWTQWLAPPWKRERPSRLPQTPSMSCSMEQRGGATVAESRYRTSPLTEPGLSMDLATEKIQFALVTT
jgi:hypothetical protein